jgi:hypothetical protein
LINVALPPYSVTTIALTESPVGPAAPGSTAGNSTAGQSAPPSTIASKNKDKQSVARTNQSSGTAATTSPISSNSPIAGSIKGQEIASKNSVFIIAAVISVLITTLVLADIGIAYRRRSTSLTGRLVRVLSSTN